MFGKRNRKEKKENPLQDKVAGKIARGFLKVQLVISTRMNKLFEKMPVKSIKVWLIGFCLASGGFSIYLFVHAIVARPAAVIKVDTIHTLRPIDRSADIITDDRVTEELYQQMQSYKKYMDSTAQPMRPGLSDSIRILEELYHEQQK